MTHRLRRIAAAVLAAALGAAHGAPPPSPPELSSGFYVLYDYHTGQVLAAKNADQRAEPASLTKIMTAYVVFEELKKGNLKLDQPVRISRNAWRTGGSRMFVEVDTEVSVEQLLHGVITQSGNDASVALAEHIAGSTDTFAELMNEAAQRLGMRGTHFVNPEGLPHPEHYTTALDLARLAAATVANFPEYYPWYALRSFTYNNITQPNRNRLLWWDPGVDGLKTGHTESAGYCLVVSGTRDAMRLIVALMGAPSHRVRFQEAQALLTYGFRFYESHRLFAANEPRTRVRVYGGAQTDLPLGLADDAYVTVPRGSYQELAATVEVERRIEAPVARGAAHGLLRVRLGEETVLERPLVALADVPQGSLYRRAVDAVRLWWESE